MDLVKKGAVSDLMAAGAAIKTAYCGPCFGAGDTPANHALSIRHTTRNFPNREGSRPGAGQMATVALMDARSIAATAANGGKLTPATAFVDDYVVPAYEFDDSVYKKRVYQGFGKEDAGQKAIKASETEIGSIIYAVKPGDGSAREQAASCQRVLGGLANIAKEYATKRYRSNVMNWGMIPFLMDGEPEFEVDDYIYVPGIRDAIDGTMEQIPAYVIKGGSACEISLHIADMTDEEKEVGKAGSLINYNRINASI